MLVVPKTTQNGYRINSQAG